MAHKLSNRFGLVLAALLVSVWLLGVWAWEPQAESPAIVLSRPFSSSLTGWVGEPLLGPSEVVLKRDTGLLRSYDSHAADGYAVATLLRASDLQYPLTITAIQVYLYRWAASVSDTVELRAQVHGIDDGVPGTVLATSAIESTSLVAGRDTLVELALVPPLVLDTPQAFFATIHYQSGGEDVTPGVLLDPSEIPHGICYYLTSPGTWTEHYDRWSEPASQGYAMIRARVTTSGGPSDYTEQLATADTFIASERDDFGSATPGTQTYILVGNNSAGLGNLRSLVQFGALIPPISGARPLAASLRIYHYEELRDDVALTLSAYRVAAPWNEVMATWSNMATNFAEAYGSATVPSHPEGSTIDHLISLDVTELVQDWFEGAVPNYGLMLVGGEGVSGSQKHFYSRQASALVPDAERPLLIVQWDLPEPTPVGTAGPTDTPTLTPTATCTLKPYPSGTPTATLTFTPSQTPTASQTTTPTPVPSVTLTGSGPTVTPSITRTPGPSPTPSAWIYLPILRRG